MFPEKTCQSPVTSITDVSLVCVYTHNAVSQRAIFMLYYFHWNSCFTSNFTLKWILTCLISNLKLAVVGIKSCYFCTQTSHKFTSQCAPKASYFDFPSACDLTWHFNNRVNDRNLFPFKEKLESCGKGTHGIPGGPLIKNSKLYSPLYFTTCRICRQ